MSGLILWKDQEMRKLRRDIDRLFSRCWSHMGVNLFLEELSGSPHIHMTEAEDAVIITAELTGVKPEDLDVSATSDTVIISGRRREKRVEGNGYYQRVESMLGSFKRTVALPCRVKVDEIEATYKAGILKITMPKEEQKRACGVKVKVK